MIPLPRVIQSYYAEETGVCLGVRQDVTSSEARPVESLCVSPPATGKAFAVPAIQDRLRTGPLGTTILHCPLVSSRRFAVSGTQRGIPLVQFVEVARYSVPGSMRTYIYADELEWMTEAKAIHLIMSQFDNARAAVRRKDKDKRR